MPDGESRFETREDATNMVEFIKGQAPIGISAPIDVGRLMFFCLPANWDPGWHPAPRRQFAVIQAGAMHVETSDGKRFRVGSGEAMMIEDTSGKGHRTTVPEGECTGVVITIPD